MKWLVFGLTWCLIGLLGSLLADGIESLRSRFGWIMALYGPLNIFEVHSGGRFTLALVARHRSRFWDKMGAVENNYDSHLNRSIPQRVGEWALDVLDGLWRWALSGVKRGE